LRPGTPPLGPVVFTAAYVVALLLIGLWKTPIDQNVAVTELAPVVWMADLFNLTASQSYRAVEAGANVVLFMPLGALVLLWRRDWTWWHATVIAFATTSVIETAQQVLRPERFASAGDLIANTVGGAIGSLSVAAVRHLGRRTAVRR
jgi:glycopeptide antibiotics resistance protein